jgi:rhamnopyranosyl-N-acetylglucosaminyl-diphospho-decaprenol beta-1,3/1,4-galactofuranosyltransferase
MTDPLGGTPRVIAVIVTYNRRELLLESLAAVQAQHRPPDAVIVVDNASADGTAAAVRARFGTAVRLAELGDNYGGAGGFAYGMALAIGDAADLIWAMDDDTVPEPGALAALLAARQDYPGRVPAIVASTVLWTDGRPHPMNTPRARAMAGAAARTAAAACGCVPIRSASFVSVLVDAAECQRRGLPRADFFLWNDDFEFTTRLLRRGVGLLCPASVVVHKTRTFGGTTVEPGERFFYEVRNKIWTLRSSSLGPAERVLYAGATLRRWVRTYAVASDRRALRACLSRGLVAGVRTSPRPNEQVLPGLAPGPAAPRPVR